MLQQLIEYFEENSVLLLGFGREGSSTYRFIRKHLPEKKIAIADLNPVKLDDPLVDLICGDNYMSVINNYDVVVKSPGISVRDVEIAPTTQVTCQLDLFLRYSGCRVVGVTGTKGKTTTSTLIYSILKKANLNTCLIGNIGIPVFERIEDVKGMTAVIEMSSHQLEFTTASPHVGVWLNLYEEHLDHYNGFAGYANAKANIARHQQNGDFFLCNAEQDFSEYIDYGNLPSEVIRIGAHDGDGDDFWEDLFTCNGHLLGAHNHHDIIFAATAARCLGIDDETIRMGVQSFGGIEHRMELVGKYGGITFYNDAIATIPFAVMSAIKALKTVDTLVFGGMDRGLDYAEFVRDLENSGVRNLICLPETGHKIGHELMSLGSKKNIVLADNMEEAVRSAFECTKQDSVCLLSPAASSYNVYKNFEEKGRHFKKLVRSYMLG